MKISHRKFVTLAVLLFTGNILLAQKAYDNTTVWKKQVAREIIVKDTEDTKKHHLRDLGIDTTLLEMIVNAVKAGKLTAYSNFDYRFTTKLTMQQFNEMVTVKPDTVIVYDPIPEKGRALIVNHDDIDYDAIKKFRILEDWTFNITTGNTDIHIEGIAPIKEIYGENGDFRGTQAMFWLKYNEVVPILDRYAKTHPDKSLGFRIWNDYFYSDVKPGEKK
jgi:hypothetical protein